MSLSWATLEDAIRAWVKSGSGLDDAHLIWANQDGPRPSGPFMTIKLGDLVPLGATDAVDHTYDSGALAGAEIIKTTRGMRSFMLTVQCFGAPTTGASSARALLANVQNAIALPSVRAALNVVGLSPFDVGRVQNVPAILGTGFEGRGVLDVQFYCTDSVTEAIGYIKDVAVTQVIKSSIDGASKTTTYTVSS